MIPRKAIRAELLMLVTAGVVILGLVTACVLPAPNSGNPSPGVDTIQQPPGVAGVVSESDAQPPAPVQSPGDQSSPHDPTPANPGNEPATFSNRVYLPSIFRDQMEDVAAPIITMEPLLPSDPSLEGEDWVEDILTRMTTSQKIGQMMIVSLDEDLINVPDCTLIEQLSPGGIFFHPGNVEEPEQLRQMAADLQDCAKANGSLPLLMTIDHEGEYINRFERGSTTFPAALALGATGDPALAREVSLAAGKELVFSGINMILGPVADVLTDLDNRVVSQRTFGGDAQAVAEFVSQAVLGYQEAGLITTLKHFPGHGSVAVDSHRELPVDTADLEGLELTHLPPFRRAVEAGSPVVMLAHVAFPEVTGDDMPASLSPTIVDLLRKDLGFDGVILSDAMDMKAVSGPKLDIAEASLSAIQAGVDLLLVTDPFQATRTRERLLAAVQNGELTKERLNQSVRRILLLKGSHGLREFPQPPQDEPDWAANAELAKKTGRQAVALLKELDQLVPIPKDLPRLLVVGPDSQWDFYRQLKVTLARSGYKTKVDFEYFPPPWGETPADEKLIPALAEKAARYDTILVFTWQAHINDVVFGDAFQSNLVNTLSAKNPLVMVVALRSPTDILQFPQIPVYLATFGTTRGQLDGLIDVLIGQEEPAGQNPLPGLFK